MKSMLKIRKERVFEGLDSYADLKVRINFHDGVKCLVNCLVCKKDKISYAASVESVQVEDIQPRNFNSSFEEKDILNKIRVRIENILTGKTSCVLNQHPDERHYEYLRNFFRENEDYKFKSLTF